MGIDSIILTGMISLSCGNIVDTDNVKQACSSGVEATARQTGVYDDVIKKEKEITSEAEDKIKRYFKTSTIEVFSTTLLIGRLALGYNSSFRLTKGPLGSQVVFETNTVNHFLKFSWDI